MEEALKLLKENSLTLLPILLTSGGIFYAFQKVGVTLFNFIKKHVTTELCLTSANKSFYDAMEWIQKNNISGKFRKIKLFNKDWGWDEKTTKSVGYGHNLIWLHKRLVMMQLVKEESQGTMVDKDTLYITYFGRSHDYVDKLIQEFKPVKKENTVNIQQFTSDGWRPVQGARKIVWDKVYFDQAKKDQLKETLEDFVNNKDWYYDNNIPYRLGLLLSGVPGSGKSTIIRAIASLIDYDLMCLPTSQLFNIDRAIHSLDEKAILYIEDIDSSSLVKNRDVDENASDLVKALKDDSSTGLSEILNAIDGISDSRGRIIIFSTNKKDNLDPALLRPGRIDLRLSIDYLEKSQFQLWLNNSFKNPIDIINNKVYSNLEIKKITIAELTNMFRMGETQEDIVNKLLGKSKIRLLG